MIRDFDAGEGARLSLYILFSLVGGWGEKGHVSGRSCGLLILVCMRMHDAHRCVTHISDSFGFHHYRFGTKVRRPL